MISINKEIDRNFALMERNLKCRYKSYSLRFIRPGGTSRGVLREKLTYFILLEGVEKRAFGECNLFKGLSYDDRADYEAKLNWVCRELPKAGASILKELDEWPSIRFGVETVLADWSNGGKQVIFPQAFRLGEFTVPINGLIWMGKKKEMEARIKEKLNAGYTSIKLKIGAIDFETELELLRRIRKQFSEKEVELRVDANGAWTFKEAREKIKRLSGLEIDYIEQPIKAGQWQEMAELAEDAPVKIALDEELIGITQPQRQHQLIQTIKPQLLILKPALVGGFEVCNQLKKEIESTGGSWVITSALESNIGLNAIAQYTALGWSDFAQGLGTGMLYENNIPGPYTVNASGLHYHSDQGWDFSKII